MIYFHICQTLENKVNDEVINFLKKFSKKNQDKDSLKNLGKITSFRSGIYTLKDKSLSLEFIIQEKTININDSDDDKKVYFFRAIRSTLSQYVEIRDGKWLEKNQLESEEIKKFKETLSKAKKKGNKLPKPDKKITDWQRDYKLNVKYDIYESNDWVKFASNSSNENGMKHDEVKVFRNAILDLTKQYSNKETLKRGSNYTVYTFIYRQEIGIVFCEILIEKQKIFLLLAGANLKTQENHWNEIISKDYNLDGKLESIHDVSRISLRAYPSWALNNSDLWSNIQKNNQYGNLSLLPEQTNFLKEFKFPKYINGQAGSGKSTMLYYLFSNIYYYKFLNEIDGDIIFLTENEKLLTHTKNSVIDLLSSNPEFEMSSAPEAIARVKNHFYSFKNFLFDLLPFKKRTLFRHEKYLTFSKFKYLYEKSKIPKYVKHKYSAELVWFTITTYIRGNSLEYRITSENYFEKMPKKGKELITYDDLLKIEKNIISPFYDKLIENEGYWDKIELIKYLTKETNIDKKYEVIFCDEAQDFSKVELNFIIKLSIYNDYDLSEVNQFPIVFAGDALQTVNPTGFRSEVLTSMIFDELTNNATNYNVNSSELEFTPTYNYRSSQTIVNLANAVQYYRKKELSAQVKQPQESKKPVFRKNESLNVFVDFETFNKNKDLREKISKKTIIIPVNNDEIDDLKEKYPSLKDYENLISSVDAKGLDFNEVAIFGFGENFLELEEKEITIYEKQYFFNKLYVAITRAQSELVIIDSNNSKKNFWEKLIDFFISSEWSKATFAKITEIEDLLIFDANDVVQSKDNILEVDAQNQKEYGILNGNIPLLNLAASHFIKLTNLNEYFLCLGEIEFLKENWKTAFKYFSNDETSSQGKTRALESLWRGRVLVDYIDYSELFDIPEGENQIKLILAKLIELKELSPSNLRRLNNNLTTLRRVINNTEWCEIIIDNFFEYIEEATDKDEILDICDILEEITNDNNSRYIIRLAKKYFELEKYNSVIRVLEESYFENKIYLRSKLEVAKRREKENDIIIFSGELAFKYDTKFFKDILNYINIKNILKNTDTYVNLYCYSSLLYHGLDTPELLTLSINVEKDFIREEDVLAGYYYKILKETKKENPLINFILERWAKNLFKSGVNVKKINIDYKDLKTISNYKDFTTIELERIEDIPKFTKRKYQNHLHNFEVINFRKFKKIKVQNLGLFNLVVGDNNVGKTSFLESLLITPDKEKLLKRLAFAYIDRTNIFPEKRRSSESETKYYTLNKNFIKNYFNYEAKEQVIQYLIYENRESWSFKIHLNNTEQKDNSIFFSNEDLKTLEELDFNEISKIPYIPYGKGYGAELAILYDDQIRVKGINKEFINSLKIFIPTITDVFITKEGTIDIRDSRFEFDRPLSQFGEGINKLFRILILIIVNKNDILVIDEIDAGIHHSRFVDFWSIVLKFSNKYNTQIVASTHNEECIEYFYETLCKEDFDKEYQKKSRVVQIKDIKDTVVRCYDFENFKLAIEDKFEIR